ncbi:MAG: hemolysin family protein [Bacteroidota bacterium]
MLGEILILILLLFMIAFLSASEVAYLVTHKMKIEIRAKKKNNYALNANYLIQKSDQLFSTIIIMYFALVVVYIYLSLKFLHPKGFSFIAIIIIVSFSILIIGRLIPRYVARVYADNFSLIAALPLKWLMLLFNPVTFALRKYSTIFSKIRSREEEKILQLTDKEEMQNLIEESSEAGKVDEEQTDIINKVIEIRDQRVYEAITPRTDIIGIDINSSIEELIDKFVESGYSKLIAFEDNLDNIKGMFLLKDLFNEPSDLKSIIRDVVFVPDTKKSLEMLNEFLEKQFSIAIVVDEFGGTAGIITVEDLIEELFGEIRDEYDEDEKVIRKISSNEFILSGKVEIDYLCEEFNVAIPEGDYETIAGYITFKLGKIPLKGESFKLDNFVILILKSDRTKIDLVKLTVEIFPEA